MPTLHSLSERHCLHLCDRRICFSLHLGRLGHTLLRCILGSPHKQISGFLCCRKLRLGHLHLCRRRLCHRHLCHRRLCHRRLCYRHRCSRGSRVTCAGPFAGLQILNDFYRCHSLGLECSCLGHAIPLCSLCGP